MRLNFKLSRDTNYYFGLLLLVVASASIVWAFFNDGFDPEDYLVYFLIYAWGFTLLLKSDSEFRLQRLEKKINSMESGLEEIENKLTDSAKSRVNGEEKSSSELYQELS